MYHPGIISVRTATFLTEIQTRYPSKQVRSDTAWAKLLHQK